MKVQASPELDARVHRAIDRAIAERTGNEASSFLPSLVTMLMKTRLTQWAATAATITGIVVLVTVLYKSAPAAFAMERVVEAYNHVRSLHVKSFGAGRQAPNEFWIQSSQQGHVEKARYFLPQTEDGPKVITWTPERTELWFQRKRGFVTFQTRRIEGWMQSMLEQSQPQLFIKRLIEDQKAGKAEVQIQEPQGDDGVVITAVNNTAHTKQICHVDLKSELVTRIETYKLAGGKEVLESRMEFGDYNVSFPEKFFSLRGELPKDVRISDRLNQVAGLAQGGMTDEQAAVETVRQFLQALIDKDYKRAGLLAAGELEEFARAEYGQLSVTAIISVGPAVAQPQWDKHGFKVPCEIEVLNKDGQKVRWKPGVYVRPGDDEMHPDYWNITGGVNPQDALISLLPDNDKYAKMTAKEAAEAFLKACAEENWEEFARFCPFPAGDQRLERMKAYLGRLQVISIGEAYRSGEYPGWYVPYEIKLRPQEFTVRLSNSNAAKRYVLTGVFDSELQVRQELKWPVEPEILARNDPRATMSPTEVAKAYFEAATKFDWEEMRKLSPPTDVDKTRSQVEEARERGVDVRNLAPAVEVGEAFWSPEHSAYFVKCRAIQVKKWNLAVRNDNAANRFLWDGGI